MEPFRIIEKLIYHRKVNAHKLDKDPIFILGHWRSGTTFLQSMMVQDPNKGWVNNFQSIVPDVILAFEWLIKPFFKLTAMIFKLKNAVHRKPLDWDDPGEETIGFFSDSRETNGHWGNFYTQNLEKHFDKYLFFKTSTPEEEKKWQKNFLYQVKKLSLKNKGKQLILKSPSHTACIKQLLGIFPNAKFIYIHRNPFEVYHSNVLLWKAIDENFSGYPITDKRAHEIIMYIYKNTIHNYLNQRDLIPEGNLKEILFENFKKDPVSILEEIYSDLRIDGFNMARPAFLQHIKPAGEYKKAKYNDFDKIIVEQIRKEWKESLEAVPYSVNGPVRKMA